LLIVCALQGDVQLGDQIGLIATHLLHIGQQLEGLVKIGNILAGAARVRAFACVVGCVLLFRCMSAVFCIDVLSWAQNAKRDKVLGSLARVKADTIGSSDESSDDDCDMSGDEDGTKKKKAKKGKAKANGKRKSKGGLAAEIEADAKAKEAKEKKDKQKEKGGKDPKEQKG
jgi:hypothetical protein